jgi:hypothetical protein
MNASHNVLTEAVRLLVDIAGPDPVHIEMSARGPKKYYDVSRVFDERDGYAHLLGYRTKGATLRHPGGMTRSLCYDADTPGHWQLLQEAAQVLAESGSIPLLEVSPVGRGGHLWIIYSGLVSADQARGNVVERAPRLREIAESWPGAGSRTSKVRLPGGKYVQPGFSQWCTLTDAYGTLLATDGRSAARVLLDYQTPVSVVQNTRVEAGSAGQHELLSLVSKQQETVAQPSRPQPNTGEVDVYWHEKYNRFLWFQFTPAQLAAIYNEQHPLQDMLQLEQNGMAFSPSVEERTPSTAITNDGRAWVDFSARNVQPDGKRDGGDALELEARRNRESKAAKPATLRKVARMLVREACAALEDAARAGEDLPTWVAQIISEAGWQHYRSLRAESIATRVARWGVTGFQHAGMSIQTTPKTSIREATQQTATMLHSSHECHQELNSLEVFAAEIRAQFGEPCSRCSCTLFYQSGPYQMCHLCYPRPAKFGRLTDEQWHRLQTLFPRRFESPEPFKWST